MDGCRMGHLSCLGLRGPVLLLRMLPLPPSHREQESSFPFPESIPVHPSSHQEDAQGHGGSSPPPVPS